MTGPGAAGSVILSPMSRLPLFLLLLLGLAPASALAQPVTSTYGGNGSPETWTGRVWVNVYEVDFDAVLDDIDVSWGSDVILPVNREVTFGVWKDDGGWTLQWSHTMTMPNTSGAVGWEEGPPASSVSVALDAGFDYAIGFYSLREASAGVGTSASAEPWGTALGHRANLAAGFPTVLPSGTLSSGFFGQQLTIDADYDVDGDGVDFDQDCDDSDATVYPGATELCDGLDNDCDGATDEGLTTDADADGYSAPGSCEGTADDCNDGDPAVNPGANETVCDQADLDCDGVSSYDPDACGDDDDATGDDDDATGDDDDATGDDDDSASGDDDDDGGGGGGGRRGCRADAAPGASWLALLALGGLLLRGRRQ